MSKTSKGLITLFTLSLTLFYLASPYFYTWKMLKAVQQADVEAMNYHINFPSLQQSLKQQIDNSFNNSASKHPMDAMAKALLQPIMNQLVEDVVDPERLALMIQEGSLSPSRSKQSFKQKDESVDSISNWYAFLVAPNRFLIQVDELALYMEIQDWHWKVTAIGLESLMEGGQVSKPKQVAIDDVIDENPPVRPIVLSEVDLIHMKQEIATSFHIDWNFDSTARVEANFNYIPVKDTISPVVKWAMALDEDGESILGQFTPEQLAQREKYNQGNTYINGMWSDTLPKLNSKKSMVEAQGICVMTIPAEVTSFNLKSERVNELQKRDGIGLVLNSMESGNISYELYLPFEEAENLKEIVIIRNENGAVLATSGSSYSSKVDPIEDERFPGQIKLRNKHIRVKGTPVTIEVYFVRAVKQIEVPVTAYVKPTVMFGERKGEIHHAKLVRPYLEPAIKKLGVDEIQSSLQMSFEEKADWKGIMRKSLKFKVPYNGNSIYSKINLDELKVLKNKQEVAYKPSKFRRSNKSEFEFEFHFLEDLRGGIEKDVEFEEISGKIHLNYPLEFETFTVNQGQKVHGVSLSEEKVTLHAEYYEKDDLEKVKADVGNMASVSLDFTNPNEVAAVKLNSNKSKSDIKKITNPEIPRYISVFSSRSINAYDKKGREIEYLGDNYLANGGTEIFFWGKPDYIKVKRITKSQALAIPVNFSLSDLKQVESQWSSTNAQ